MSKRIREVDEYLSSLEPERRHALTKLRGLIFGAVRDVVETVRYRKPTCDYRGGMLCAFASQKRYMSLYMDPRIVEVHRGELGGLSVGKSCIRFKKLEDLPVDTLKVMLSETAQTLDPK